MLALVFCVCGCRSRTVNLSNVADYKFDYESVLRSVRPVRSQVESERLTFSCTDLSLREFSFWFSRNTSYGLIYASSLDKEKISCDFVQSTVADIADLVARRLGKSVKLVGKTYYIGDVPETDRSILVRKVYGFSREEIKSFVDTVSGFSGRCFVTPDGVVSVTDSSSVLSRVGDLLDSLGNFQPTQWVVQFFVVQVHDNFLANLGFDIFTSGDLSLLFSKGFPVSFDYRDLGLRLAPVLSGQDTFSSLVCCPMFLLRDGYSGSWADGKEVPVPQKTVSDAGTVTTSGYQHMQTGLKIDVVLRESLSGVFCKLKLEDSSISSYIEYAPVLLKTTFVSDFCLVPDKLYLLGELSRRSGSGGVKHLFSWERTNNFSRCLVFARAYCAGVLSDVVDIDNCGVIQPLPEKCD